MFILLALENGQYQTIDKFITEWKRRFICENSVSWKDVIISPLHDCFE